MRLITDKCPPGLTEWQHLPSNSLSNNHGEIGVCLSNSTNNMMDVNLEESIVQTCNVICPELEVQEVVFKPVKRRNECIDSSEPENKLSKSCENEIPDKNSNLTTSSIDKENINNTSDAVFMLEDNFAIFPDEILLMVFKHFSKATLVSCASVCRRWRSIAFDNRFWQRIDLSRRKIRAGVMTIVLHRNPVILKMSQTEIHSPIFESVQDSMENRISKLEYLDLSMATVLLHDLELLFKTCRSLLKLSLEFCELNENICNEIGKNLKLTVLNMSLCCGVNEAGLKHILLGCEKLIELNIAWTGLSSACIKSVSQYLTTNILKLNLSGCLKELFDSHICALVMRCNKLQELDISDAGTITHKSVLAIYNNLKQLRVISISRCYQIYPGFYSKLLSLSSLTNLNVFGILDDTQIERYRKLRKSVEINQNRFSFIARPTVGDRRSSIWCLSVRD